MNQKVLKQWIAELKIWAKKSTLYHLRFPLRMESVIGDLVSPEGVLCLLHSKETGTKWTPEPEEKGQLRSSLWYFDETLGTPKKVLEWAGLTSGLMCNIRRINDEQGFEGVIKHLESL